MLITKDRFEREVAMVKNTPRYFPGQYIGLDSKLESRRVAIILSGPDKIVTIKPLKILTSRHIDFCFGSRNVHVHFPKIASTTLDHWLERGTTFAEDITGFSGPAGTVLYIVFSKKSLL
ncbi:MAG: hypothetical protein HY226_01090 [Candidatus Vogelbacteria bacterium]|nr:hypothetical protein [Candidatus Vogelbacteria bacterium]